MFMWSFWTGPWKALGTRYMHGSSRGDHILTFQTLADFKYTMQQLHDVCHFVEPLFRVTVSAAASGWGGGRAGRKLKTAP